LVKENIMNFSKKSWQKIFLAIFLGFLVFSPLSASAAGLVPCGGECEPVCQLCHVFVLFKNIIEFLLFIIIPPLVILLIAWGGILYIFSGGNPANINKANSIFKSIAIALLIIYGSWLIVNLFFQVIGVQEWTGLESWWKIEGCPDIPIEDCPEQ
jgi:hypothetical protein